jgi:hypothetical protein
VLCDARADPGDQVFHLVEHRRDEAVPDTRDLQRRAPGRAEVELGADVGRDGVDDLRLLTERQSRTAVPAL